MNTKNIILGFLMLSSSLIHCADNEISVAKQDEIIQSLLEEKVDLLSLDPETFASYIKIMEDHKAVLKHIIAKQTGFFDNIHVIKGLFGTWFGLNWLFNNVCFLMIHYQNYFDWNAKVGLQHVKEFALNRPREVSLYGVLIILSLSVLKTSCDDFYQAWHKKGRAMKELAKTDELLAQLEDIKFEPVQ